MVLPLLLVLLCSPFFIVSFRVLVFGRRLGLIIRRVIVLALGLAPGFSIWFGIVAGLVSLRFFVYVFGVVSDRGLAGGLGLVFRGGFFVSWLWHVSCLWSRIFYCPSSRSSVSHWSWCYSYSLLVWPVVLPLGLPSVLCLIMVLVFFFVAVLAFLHLGRGFRPVLACVIGPVSVFGSFSVRCQGHCFAFDFDLVIGHALRIGLARGVILLLVMVSLLERSWSWFGRVLGRGRAIGIDRICCRCS